MTSAPHNGTSPPNTPRGACVLLCESGASGGPTPPDVVLRALSARQVRPLPVASEHLAMAMLVRLENDAAQSPRPILFIACAPTTPSDEFLRAIRAYCPSTVCRRFTEQGRIVPLEPAAPAPHTTNGRTPPKPTPGRKPDLRLTGEPNEPHTTPNVEKEPDASDDITTLTDDELNMLLSDDWNRRADGTQA